MQSTLSVEIVDWNKVTSISLENPLTSGLSQKDKKSDMKSQIKITKEAW